MKHVLLSLIALTHATLLLGHGFSANTLVLLADNTWQQISTVCYRTHKKNAVTIASYDTTSSYQARSKTVRGGRSRSNCFIRFGFDEKIENTHQHEVACTPTQEFYSATTYHTYTVDAYNANTFEQYVKQQPQVPTFSEPQVTLSPDYKEKQQITDVTAGETYGEYTFSDDNENSPCCSITIHNPPKEQPGCGDITPQEPLILITPAEPTPVFQNPGYRPLSDEERKLLSGGCTLIPIPKE